MTMIFCIWLKMLRDLTSTPFGSIKWMTIAELRNIFTSSAVQSLAVKDRWRDWRFVRSGRWQSFWIQFIGRWFWCTHLKWQSEQIIMHIYVIFCDVSIIFHEHICNRWVNMFSQMCSGKFNISLHVLLWDLRKECFAEFRHLKKKT